MSDYLAEYISAMESREEAESGDVLAQLRQKQDDLLLAAQLGKALLEKNEQLSMENERMAEQYSKHLEELEQEKHSLRRKMTSLESEYESRVSQLQADLSTLKQEMETEHHSDKDAAEHRSQIIAEFTEQNQRLTRQLRDAIKNEEQLNMQLQQMRSQQDLRSTSISDHMSHMDIMRDEINILTDKRLELERRVQSLMEEREQLTNQLEEASERLLMLEQMSRQQNGQLRQTQREVVELAATNTSLTDRLEVLSRGGHSTPSTAHTSLMNELEDEGISSGCHLPAGDDSLLSLEQQQQLQQLRADLLQVCRGMCALAGRCAAAGHSADAGCAGCDPAPPTHTLQASHVQDTFDCLERSVQQLLETGGGGPAAAASEDDCAACGRPSQLRIEIDLHALQEQHDRLQKQHSQQADTLKRQAEELSRHMHQLTIKEKQYEALKEERDILKDDLSNTHLSKEELIKKAWEVRDRAVARKNSTEIELARSRIDVMQINSQLLESIQQKVELSCQLDQWQADMQQLLDEQMRKKLSQIEQHTTESETGSTGSARQKKSLLGIFGRT